MKPPICIAAMLLVGGAGPVLAQESTHFKLEFGTFNAGGRPSDGVVAQSASYLLSLDAIGDGSLGTGLTSPGFSMDSGLAATFQPPGEVANLRFTSATGLQWDPDTSVGDYALYQGLVGLPFPAGYGSCAQPPPAITTNTTAVTSLPAERQASFYLVTARNRLAEEGTKGFTSAGVQRANLAPCP